ncbi:hypothetical protein NP493_62g04007 [Ridgeia piscesae]|uniref:CUB domain-containing protein n=1 Tax=Ridgeia piscesae TaxID=27915 RepID=A0AAD9PAM1_RIDPI|nr:hypothetical protein NP493_62g04007 [Ridgeia piscesae]
MTGRMQTAAISCFLPLLVSVFVDIVWGQANGQLQDYCFPESFNATCSGTGRVILMQSARYGRMKTGRCLSTDYRIGCGADVLTELDRSCSGRHHCEVKIPDKRLHSIQPCEKDMFAYLEAAYICLPVETGYSTGCSSNDGIVLTRQSGYLASVVARDLHIGTRRCPWVIRVSPWQRVNLTLLDFGVSLTYSTDRNVCRVYAKVRETGIASDVTICGGRERERAVYLSEGSRVEIRIVHFNAEKNPAHFILKYEVVGCVDPDIPTGATMSRTLDKAVVTCNETEERWHIVCHGKQWIGELGSCSLANSEMAGFKSHSTIFPFGLLVAVVAGILLGAFLGFLFLAAVILCHRRQTRSSRARLSREPQYTPCAQHAQRPVYIEAELNETEDISFDIVGGHGGGGGTGYDRKSSSDKYGVAMPVTAQARYPVQYPGTELVFLNSDTNSYERPSFKRMDKCKSPQYKTAVIPCYYEAGQSIPDIVADNIIESGV